tara:strand:+ start:2755 stop:3063 length:309 start_codon:yes stop_codon:yes gene_type:complete
MTYREKLEKLMEENPELVFDNDGYENLSKSVVERNKDSIKEVESILKKCVFQFIRFQNFKPRKDGSFAVRCQTDWADKDKPLGSFVGVSYFPLDSFDYKESE